jgi:glycosyltransferase involved in cell wall biosynthesis
MVPVGLSRKAALSRVITDLWVTPGSITAALVPRLRGVYHPELDGHVSASNVAALAFEARQSLRRASGWTRTIRRNEWFQSTALHLLSARPQDAAVMFSYSYAARRLFEYAKSKGWKTVLGQIDPGLTEERLVASLHAANPDCEPNWQPAPPEYWRRWREEIALADRIVVNSKWSREALIAEGISEDKLVVIPLAYQPPADAASFQRTYPDRFSKERPLRVLFLGQVILRKGALALLDAAQALRNEPIEFVVAGPSGIGGRVPGDANVRWLGAVPRSRTAAIYQGADVFLFPTLSDGFGLTQLEAQAWRLPLISTRNCGDVVRDGINGTLLQDGSGEEIAAVLRRMLAEPASLQRMSHSSRVDDRHSLDSFADALQKAIHA